MSQFNEGDQQRFWRKKRKEDERKAGLPDDDEPQLPPPVEPIRSDSGAPGRNDPCPCGSGKKYKKCCGK